SVKVFRGQCNLASRGHVQGGRPRYGLKHVLVRDDGKPVGGGLHRTKKLRGYHVELAPGPKKEVRIGREIFRRYVELGERDSEIAAYLNSKRYKTRKGFPWDYQRVGSILVDEQYIGTLVYNKASEKKLEGRY